MRIIKKVSKEDVLNYWKKVDPKIFLFKKKDIFDPLPEDIQWFEAVMHKKDIDKLHIISSTDWDLITKTTYLLKNVNKDVNSFDIFGGITEYNKALFGEEVDSEDVCNLRNGYDTMKLASAINAQLFRFVDSCKKISRKLIVVSNDINGPFTIIDGNKRAVAMFHLKKLVGQKIYLGISKKVSTEYKWSRFTYGLVEKGGD